MSNASPEKKPIHPRPTEDRTSQLIDYVEALADVNKQSGETETVSNLHVDRKLNEIASVVEMQLDQFLVCIDQKLNQFLTQLDKSGPLAATRDNAGPVAAAGKIAAMAPAIDKELTFDLPAQATRDNSLDTVSTDDMLNDWNSRKRRMLAEYGMSGDEIAAQTSVAKPAESTKPAITTTGSTFGKKKDLKPSPTNSKLVDDDGYDPTTCCKLEPLGSLHNSIAQLDKIDSSEIVTLKEQLTSKLREAEVELSINRAKLSQQWAALELKQAELEQRETRMHSKYGNLSPAAKKEGLLGRLSRHMVGRTNDSPLGE